MKPERTPLVITETDGKTKLLNPDKAHVIGDRGIELALEELVGEDNPETKVEVAKIIPSFLPTDRTRDLLEELANDEDPAVREQARASIDSLS